jgi:4-amino-4-deoxy-L-arabinose transferase-like glycosyltransferase
MDRAAVERTIAWVVVLSVAWVALAIRGYGSRDPDSRLYAEITAQMAQAPAAGWIAPAFPPGWFMTGPFREHPVGLFVPAALVAKLGYPAGQAAYAMNALYQAATLVLLPALAAALVSGSEARALGWVLQLLPIAFTYRIRANHEQALLLCLVLALLGTERSRRNPRFAALTAVGLVGLLLVKGVFAVFGPALCALWLLTAPPPASPGGLPARRAWLGLGLASVAMVVAAALYEVLYRQATGEPFWSFYLSRQLGVAAASGIGHAAAQKSLNLVWYLGRVLWFSFPWSLVLLASAVTEWLARRPTARRSEPAEERPLAAGAAFVAGTLLLYVLAFSLFDRRADRYVFPAYFAVGAAGAVAALRRSPRFTAVAARLDRPWTPAAVFLLTFLAHLLAGPLGVPTVKIPPS